jgi:malonyl CoA-acyl carrier protein transacylase
MTKAFVFPGQGSQAVGMGRELAEAFAPARLVFEEINDALDQNLSKLMFKGPDDELRLTENAQPALMAVSMAIVRVLAEEGGIVLDDKAAFVAGHSLGEYSALAAAGAIGVADTARLLKLRGQSMQEAVPVGEGAMAALLGLDLDTAREVADEAAEDEVCDVGNDNAAGQVVLSGHGKSTRGNGNCRSLRSPCRKRYCRECGRPAHHPPIVGRTGNRHGPLARKCPVYEGAKRRYTHRVGCWQCAHRPNTANRPGNDGPLHPSAR